jgi:hypothetical protein
MIQFKGPGQQRGFLSIVVGAALVVGGIAGNLKAGRKQRKASRLQREAALIRNFVERRKAIRDALAIEGGARAAITGTGIGLEKSSSARSLSSRVRTDLESGLNTNTAIASRSDQAGKELERAQRISQFAAIASEVGGRLLSFGISGAGNTTPTPIQQPAGGGTNEGAFFRP